ncbi:peroxidase 29-like isoform X2 [Aristolochia californica]|uniref:peroxidase 29-like isoform X2 n=1 Tax=Aristolochia californica TaxID=171875 RepID=UPI0035E3015C
MAEPRKGHSVKRKAYFLPYCGGGNSLSYSFYDETCPQVERLVREGLSPVFLADPTSPAALLRLMFHDCQVQGCDASILLDSQGDNVTSEMTSDKNFGIRKRDAIGMIKSVVETECPGQVSCADLLVLAAREAVCVTGGPRIRVPLGRRDALTASYKLADALLPSAATGVDAMLGIFTDKGMNAEEAVALLGAHTIGISHCININMNREDQPEEKIGLRSQFQKFLKLSCRKTGSLAKTTFLINDLTNLVFDNQYYRDIVDGRGLLRVDAEISKDPRTAPIVAEFARDQNYFFEVFTTAFIKLASSGVLTGDQGRVVRSCNRID